MGVRSTDHQKVGGKQYFDSDVQFAGATVGGKREVISLTNVATTARTLAADESGALVSLDNNTNTATTLTVTLPTAEAGLWFDFVIPKDCQHNGADLVITTGVDAVDFVGAIQAGEAGNVNSVSVAHSKITNDCSATGGKTLGGTTFSVVCDGSHWYITNFVTPPDFVSTSVGAGLVLSGTA